MKKSGKDHRKSVPLLFQYFFIFPVFPLPLCGGQGTLLLIVNLSEVEAALGNHSDALLLAERALRLEPQSDIAKECLARRKAEAGKQGK